MNTGLSCVVQEGDTLGNIAENHGVLETELISVNPQLLENCGTMIDPVEGNILNIPKESKFRDSVNFQNGSAGCISVRKYNEVRLNLTKRQVAFLMVEGIGVLGSYVLHTSCVVEKRIVSLYVSLNVPAKNSREINRVTGFGSAKLFVDNQMESEKKLKIPSGPSLYDPNMTRVGSANFNLPNPNTTASVKVLVSAGYIATTSIGSAVPVPFSTEEEIKIEIIDQ